jgi:hypothetical protein
MFMIADTDVALFAKLANAILHSGSRLLLFSDRKIGTQDNHSNDATAKSPMQIAQGNGAASGRSHWHHIIGGHWPPPTTPLAWGLPRGRASFWREGLRQMGGVLTGKGTMRTACTRGEAEAANKTGDCRESQQVGASRWGRSVAEKSHRNGSMISEGDGPLTKSSHFS